MNKTQKFIIGGMLVAGAAAITGGGLTVAGSHDAHSAKPAAQAPVGTAVKGDSVSLTDDDGTPKRDHCKDVHKLIEQGKPVTEIEAVACDNDELQVISRRTGDSSQSESATCQDVNAQIFNGRAQNIPLQVQKLCKGEEKAVERKLAKH
jgi:hypothetical protein